MIGGRFRSAALVAGATASALAFYMISLSVSAERSAVAHLERRIASDVAHIRSLQTELGTRGRLPQLERWNAEVLSLSAPKAGQYLNGAVELAAFAPQQHGGMDAHIQQAVVVNETPAPPPEIHNASLSVDTAGSKPLPAAVTAAYEPVVPAAPRRSLLQTAAYQSVSTETVAPAVQAMAKATVKVAGKPVRLLGEEVLGEVARAAASEANGLKRPLRP